MNDIIFLLTNPGGSNTVALYINCLKQSRHRIDVGEILEYTAEHMVVLYSPHVGTNYRLSIGSNFSQMSNNLYDIKEYYNGSFTEQKSLTILKHIGE
jgi:hypothetical protein|nr:MAG TPA: hypothetical protein [Caudoviricetes sp.]